MNEGHSQQGTQEEHPGATGADEWLRRLLIPFASMRYRDFRLLWFGQLGQALAMWAEIVGRNWLAWQLTGSATVLGLVNLAQALPLIAVGMLGGVLADRFDKRKILIVIQAWNLCVYVLMAALILSGWVRLWHVYMISVLLGAGMAMNQPVRTSFIPQLVEARLVLNALSLNSIAINATRLIGPALIGALIAITDSVAPAYIISAIVYGLVLVSTAKIESSGGRPKDDGLSMGGQLLEGVRYMLLENRMVLALIVIAIGPLAFAFSYTTLLPAYVSNMLKMDVSAYGAIQSIAAVGALAGGFALATMGHIPHRGKIMMASGIIYGFGIMALGGVRLPALAFGVVVIAGASQTVFRASNYSALLNITPERLQGRIVSMVFLDTAMHSVASILGGRVTDVWNVTAGMATIGAICVAIVAAVSLVVPAVRRV